MSPKLLLLTCVYCQILGTFGEKDTRPKLVRPLGGEDCMFKYHPYATAVTVPLRERSHLCAGTLISLQWVITTGSCFKTPLFEEGAVIILKAGFGGDIAFVQERLAKKGVVHDKYKEDADIRYDVGLLLADAPFVQSTFLQPAKLPLRGLLTTCDVMTWVSIARDKTSLVCVTLFIESREKCIYVEPMFALNRGNSTICGLDKAGNQDACEAPFGGGTLCRDALVGVLVSNIHCGQKGSPHLSVKIEQVLGFIGKHTHLAKPRYSGSDGFRPRKSLLIAALLLCHLLLNKFRYR